MRANHVNKNSIQLRGEDIEDMEQFTYLGSVVSRDGGTDRNIKSRIGKVTAALRETHLDFTGHLRQDQTSDF